MDTFLSIVTFYPFDPQVIWLLVALVMLLFCSAMTSGAETALFALSPANVSEIENTSSKKNSSILKLLSDEDSLLATVLVANNLINICIIILSNTIIDHLIDFTGAPVVEFVGKVVVVTFILLLFGEIIPKIFAAYNPLRFAQMVAVPLVGLKSLFRPISFVLIRSSRRLNDKMAARKPNISIDELSDAIEMTDSQNEEERQILSGIVGFVNTEVEEIMKPRIDIVALANSVTFSEVRNTIIESGFSRIPIFEDSVDNIVGVLYVKDMIPFIAEDDDFNWVKHLRKPYFVPEHKKISDLLEAFQEGKVHMAIVVDEYGSTLGLVSLEDILEEIVGEITDESDIDVPTFYTKVDDNTYIFDGKTHISELEEVLGFDEDTFSDVKGDAETVAGLMLEIKKDFLKQGESVLTHGVRFTVKAIDGRRIDKIRVRIIQKRTDPA